MAETWSGKSRGTVLGYKIFVYAIKKLGVSAAYSLLYFVATYFLLFSKKSSKVIYTYFRKRHQYTKTKSFVSLYQSYYKFGQTIIDKIAISSGLRNRFTYEFDGINELKKLLQEQKGGVLISAHVGNFEIAEFFLDDLDEKAQINLLTTDFEHRAIKDYLESITLKSSIKFIILKEDLSHIFEINAALARNELVCMTGDRYVEGTKYLSALFLGKEAKFPAGPFLIASRLKVPVVFVYVMKEAKKHYHLYARTVEVKHRDSEGLLKSYIQNLEIMLKKYPTQWFNYFDFWGDYK
ncbi:LpxL/LpxP family acyltransferase [Tenacibaculum caenipelagi]|uniref:Putative LPLAT superfamily acyltransferase n=1 Tax=Tenacibaculum caenipelagi TaxID=1325435 RepID=A0A4R6TG87_9FLAO|nr:lipid A biosynthesis acyltransferase [Tenacibaculum caenipelagi]TDQ28853.1 putative LPLAT superfamily acyltransferase [Tenacibaculum caenipelagi]